MTGQLTPKAFVGLNCPEQPRHQLFLSKFSIACKRNLLIPQSWDFLTTHDFIIQNIDQFVDMKNFGKNTSFDISLILTLS